MRLSSHHQGPTIAASSSLAKRKLGSHPKDILIGKDFTLVVHVLDFVRMLGPTQASQMRF